jgi:LysM repeat protein
LAERAEFFGDFHRSVWLALAADANGAIWRRDFPFRPLEIAELGLWRFASRQWKKPRRTQQCFAKTTGFRMNHIMKFAICACLGSAFLLTLSSCSNTGSGGGSAGLANTGPFDRNGNYVEEWADNPAKWRKSGGPPSPHELKTDVLPEIALNDQPPSNSVPLASSRSSRPTPPIQQTKVVSRPTTAVAAKPKTPAKPAPIVAKKAAPKPPAASRYVVKKGDTLSGIASRHGSSVKAIQSANRISGTIIRPGQALSIPKR